MPAGVDGVVSDWDLAIELLHLPGKPAGVDGVVSDWDLAIELLHPPGMPAGVYGVVLDRDLAIELLHPPGKPAGVVTGQPNINEPLPLRSAWSAAVPAKPRPTCRHPGP
jgi:hypothetical protein